MNVLQARQRVIGINDPSGVGEARRVVARLSTAIALDEARAGDLALAVTEAATNIVKHAREGVIAVRILSNNDLQGIEVLAIDKGAGISNVAASMRDGHSTTGTAGEGLGALRRVTSALEIWSSAQLGTIVRFEVWPRAYGTGNAAAQMGVIAVEKSGESVSGDGWVVLENRSRIVVFVGDGLGHGPEAAAAVQAAIALVEKNHERDPVTLLDIVHHGLRSTRGAAGAIAVFKPDRQECEFCGVGNISAAIHAGGKMHSLVSNNGTLGQQIRTLQSYHYPFPGNALFIAHSDGITTRWELAKYPGLDGRHPAVITAMLYRDHNRGRDDLTVLALRNRADSAP